MGTNDLVNNDPQDVVASLDSFIKDVMIYSNMIAISSVIERNDGRVPRSKITTFNNLTRDLCAKRAVRYIDNYNNIDK